MYLHPFSSSNSTHLGDHLVRHILIRRSLSYVYVSDVPASLQLTQHAPTPRHQLQNPHERPPPLNLIHPPSDQKDAPDVPAYVELTHHSPT
jgi:hypothetical protein